MASIVNRWTGLGRLADNPKQVETKNDTVMCFITIAITRSSNRDTTDYIDIAVYGKVAQAVLDYKKKGDEVLVEAELQTYQDEENNYKQVLSATNVLFLRDTQSKTQGTFE